MGKRRKEELTAYEQQNTADALWEEEQKLFGSGGFSRNRYNEYDDDYNEKPKQKKSKGQKKWEKDHKPVNFSKTPEHKLRTIQFIFNEDLDRVILDDGVVPTPFYVGKFDDIIQLNEDVLDAYLEETDDQLEDFSTIFTSIYLTFLLSCKHPTAIMTKKKFISTFASIVDVYGSFDKFHFFQRDNYIFIYVVDEEMENSFMEWMDDHDMNDVDQINCMINFARCAMDIHNCFDFMDDAYVEAMMNRKDMVAVVDMIMHSNCVEIDSEAYLTESNEEPIWERLKDFFNIVSSEKLRRNVLLFNNGFNRDEFHPDQIMKFMPDIHELFLDDEYDDDQEYEFEEDGDLDDDYEDDDDDPYLTGNNHLHGNYGSDVVQARITQPDVTMQVTKTETKVTVNQQPTQTVVSQSVPEIKTHEMPIEEKPVERTTSTEKDGYLTEDTLAQYISAYKQQSGIVTPPQSQPQPKPQTVVSQPAVEPKPQPTTQQKTPIVLGNSNPTQESDGDTSLHNYVLPTIHKKR